MSLSIFGYARASEDAEARPVIDCRRFAQKCINLVSTFSKRVGEAPEDVNGERFLFRPGGRPCLMLRNDLT
jgi:hypothetical protein